MKSCAIVLLILFALLGGARAQRGEKSVAGGMFVTFLSQPTVDIYDFGTLHKSNVGLEAVGQYNFTDKSAVLLQLQPTRFTGQEY